MRHNRMIPIAVAFLLLLAVAALCGQTQQDTPAAKLQAKFKLVDDRFNLYEISEAFVLQASFDPSGELLQVWVAPRYFFNSHHPEWKEPEWPVHLSDKTYEDVLSRIQAVKSLGDLAHRGTVSYTTNSQSHFWDEYSGGVVERVLQGENAFTGFTAYYLHPVSGKVEWMEQTDNQFADLPHRVKIDGKTYYVPKGAFSDLEVGKDVSIPAAGPL